MNVRDRLFPIVLLLASIYFSLHNYHKGDYSLAKLWAILTLVLIFYLVSDLIGYHGDSRILFYSLAEPLIKFWFEILKLLFLLSAISYGVIKTQNYTLKIIYDLSYLFVYVFLLSSLLHGITFIESNAEAKKLSKNQKRLFDVLLFLGITLGCLFFLKIYSLIPDIVNNLSK